MIKHTKFAKSNVPAMFKPKRRKNIKKILSSCGTPRKIFSKSTSRNGSPCPPSSKPGKKLTGQVSKIKPSATTARIKYDTIYSFASSSNLSGKVKKPLKVKKVKAFSSNLSPKNREKSENNLNLMLKESIDLSEKPSKSKPEVTATSQLKQVLQKILMENSVLKNKLRRLSDNQEEPKSTMNSNSIETAIEEIKSKLRSLKQKFL